MARFDVIVDFSAMLTVCDVEAASQKEANDIIERQIKNDPYDFGYMHRNDIVLCDPVVYHDNEEDE